jgi:hypothetical protein
VVVLLGFPSAVLLLQFFLKDVAIHLALPYNQKLPKASSVSLDRFFMGGAHEVAPTTSGWSLALYASLLSAFFCRVLSGPVYPFQCQALERWLELSPSRDCEAHSAGKKSFASYAKRHLLQLDASSRRLDAAAFNPRILTVS